MITFNNWRYNMYCTVSRVKYMYISATSGLVYNRYEISSFIDLSVRELFKLKSPANVMVKIDARNFELLC